MKIKTLTAAAMIAVIGAGLASCGGGEKAKDGKDTTKAVTGTRQGDAYETNINIRYVDMDSLMAHYEYAQDQQVILQQIEVELQQYQNQLGRNLQGKQAAIQQKLQSNGYLSEASYKADMEELQKLDQAAQSQYGQRAQTAMTRAAEINKAVSDAIQEYVVKYNKDKKYDAILHKEVGLYFNPALDITGELVKGLNEAYRAKKADAPKEEKK